MKKQKVYSHERGLRTLKEGVKFEGYKEKYPSAIKVRVPNMATMNRWVSDCISKTPDGCIVEPDGMCEHGYPSWLRVLCFI